MFMLILGSVFSDLVFAQSNAQTPGSVTPWANTTPLTSARSLLGAVAQNGYLYAIGGYYENSLGENGSALSSVAYAQINSDGTGTVGAWNSTTALPTPILNGGVAAYNGYVYVAGGSSELNGSSSRTVYYAFINQNGTLGQWHKASSMIDRRSEFNLVVQGSYLYAVGGYNGSKTGVFANVEYARIKADGSLGKWRKTLSLPQAEWGAGVAVQNGKIYAIGGYAASGTSQNVYFTAINADGSLAGWNATAALPVGLWAMGASSNQQNIFVIGGAKNGGTDGTPVERANSQQVYFAQVNPDGSIQSWNKTNPIAAQSASFGSALNNGYLYVVGGTTWGSSVQPMNTVQYSRINAKPVISGFSLNQDDNTLTVSGQGFNPVASGNYVLFQSSAGSQDYYYVTPSSSSDASLTVTIPPGPMSGKIKVISYNIESDASEGTLRVLVDGSQGCRPVGPPGSTRCLLGGKCNEFSATGTSDCIFPANFADNALDLLIVRDKVALRTGITYANNVTINGRVLNQGELSTNCATGDASNCSTLSISSSGTLTNKASILNAANVTNSGTISSSSANGIYNGYDIIHAAAVKGSFTNSASGRLTLASSENYGVYNGDNGSTFTNSGVVSVQGTNPTGFYNSDSTSVVVNNAGGVITIDSGFMNSGSVANKGTIRKCGTGTYSGTAPTTDPVVTTGCSSSMKARTSLR